MMTKLIATLLAFACVQAFAAPRSVLLVRPALHQEGDIYNPKGFWPLLGFGLGYMDEGSANHSEGVPTHLKLIGSYYFQSSPWVADLGLGLHNQVFTQKGNESGTAQALYSEIAARYQFTNRWQVGALWNTLVGSADRYHSNTQDLTSFLGVQCLKEFAWKDDYLVRLGGRAVTDVGIRGGTVSSLMAELQVSFGPGPEQVRAPIVESAPAEPVAPHLDTHAMHSFALAPGRVNFKSNSVELVSSSKAYVRRLARALAVHHELFSQIQVVGHADQRGTNRYNFRLSQRRAMTIADQMMKAGIHRGQLVAIGLGKTDLLSDSMSPLALLHNRRVELQFKGVKNYAALKKVLDSVPR